MADFNSMRRTSSALRGETFVEKMPQLDDVVSVTGYQSRGTVKYIGEFKHTTTHYHTPMQYGSGAVRLSCGTSRNALASSV